MAANRHLPGVMSLLLVALIGWQLARIGWMLVPASSVGDRIDATVPVAANRPYWFETGGGWTSCTGDAAAWTFFGQADSHFTMQSYPGEYGDECRDFWVDTRGCDDADPFALAWGADGECVAYAGCSSDVRYCLYEASAAHGAPSYYSAAAMDWFVERAGR